ncbi:uncharacterized protein LOC133168804 [Syngnathus typhle]|uniref:uncharacterized protein LOC133168804 n=1 Tax=Syngnathus typhle TaxID=161592 RepID=UPI002A6ADC5C|nr:uncharacterized protein LOC133168804 [Syngnathus typhle]
MKSQMHVKPRVQTVVCRNREHMTTYRQQTQASFSEKIKQAGERVSDEQESAAARFQADVLNLERHFESQLRELSESHAEQKLLWEERLSQSAEEWQKMAQEATERLNVLQESLQANEDLLARSDKKAEDDQVLLKQTVEDFRQEREEFQNSYGQLEMKYQDVLSISRQQTAERISLLTERDDLKLRIEDMERLLKQAAEDFELDRKELQREVAILEEKVKGSQSQDLHLSAGSIPENSFGEEVKSDPTNEPDQDAPQLKMEASEDQEVSWTRQASNDPESSNVGEPDDKSEDPYVTSDLESPKIDVNKNCQDQDSSQSGALDKHQEERRPQDVASSTMESLSQMETTVGSLDPCELSEGDATNDHDSESDWDNDFNEEHTNVSPELLDQDIDDELQDFELQSSDHQSKEENVLLQEKIFLLQQKTELLQSLLEHNSKKIQTGCEYLEENYSLKVKMFLLMEHIKVLEIKTSKLTELQARHEDYTWENVTLKRQNAELKKMLRRLQSQTSDERSSLADDVGRIRRENRKLSDLMVEFQGDTRSRISETSRDFEVNTIKLHQALSETQAENTSSIVTRTSPLP